MQQENKQRIGRLRRKAARIKDIAHFRAIMLSFPADDRQEVFEISLPIVHPDLAAELANLEPSYIRANILGLD